MHFGPGWFNPSVSFKEKCRMWLKFISWRENNFF